MKFIKIGLMIVSFFSVSYVLSIPEHQNVLREVKYKTYETKNLSPSEVREIEKNKNIKESLPGFFNISINKGEYTLFKNTLALGLVLSSMFGIIFGLKFAGWAGMGWGIYMVILINDYIILQGFIASAVIINIISIIVVSWRGHKSLDLTI